MFVLFVAAPHTGLRGLRPAPHRHRGFTLIEVMIVIAIVLALSGLIGVALFRQRDAAKADTVKIDMNSLKAGLDLFRLDYDRYPSDEEGLAVLWDKTKLSASSGGDTEADTAKWKGYMKEAMPNDKWGSPWGYRQVSEHGDETTYDLWSYGPDKQDGTDDDIVSWNKEGEGMGADSSGGAPPPPPPPPGG
jgi:general secretion pathway protein G